MKTKILLASLLVAWFSNQALPAANSPVIYANGCAWNLISQSCVPVAAGGAATWGAIVGTLGNQADLVAALSGKQATLGYTPLNAASNLSDLGSVATARTNLGLGSAALQPSSAFQSALTFGSVSTTTTGVTVGSGANSTVGPSVTVDIQNATNAQPGLLTAADHTSFAAKEPAVTATTAADYYRGDKTFQNFNTAAQAAVSATAPIVDTAGVFSMPKSDASTDGYLAMGDFAVFAAKEPAVTSATVLDYYRGDKTFQNFSTAAQAAVSATAPIVDTAGVFSIPAATNAVDGYLTAADHTSFAAKLGSGLTTNHIFVGVAGVATDVAMSGDATIASSGALTLAANAVTNAKAAQMAAHTFKGNNTGATANAIDLTVTQATAELNVMVGDSGAGGTKGLVPAAGAGDAAAGKFLKADGTFAVPYSSLNSKVYYVSATGNDANVGYDINKPFLTLSAALTAAGNSGNQVCVTPGIYAGNYTVSNLNVTITTCGMETGGLVSFTGTITVSNASSSIRIVGLTIDTLVHSGAGSLYLRSVKINTSLTSSNSGYLEVRQSEIVGPTNTATVSITGSGNKSFLDGSQIGAMTVNNASAVVNSSNNIFMIQPTLSAGVLGIANTPVYSPTAVTNAIISSGASSVLYLTNVNLLTPTNTAARMSAASGFYSIRSAYFDKANSVLTGTDLAQDLVTDSVNSAAYKSDAFTASTAPVINASKQIVSSAVTSTELGYVSGVTSSIQTQINGKQNTLTIGNLTDAGTDGITVTGGTSAVIGAGTSLSQHVADATHNGYLSAADWISFNAAAGGGVTSLTGEATGSGPGATAVTLSNAAVIGKVLTGFSSGAGVVAATDSILQAIQKLDGNVAGKQATLGYTPLNAASNLSDLGSVATARSNLGLGSAALQPSSAFQSALTFGSVSTTTTGVTVGSGANSTVGPNVTVDIQNATNAQPGLLTAADHTSFAAKEPAVTATTAADYYRGDKTFQNFNTAAQAAVSATAPIVDTAGVFSMPKSDASTDGYLAMGDFAVFAAKEPAVTSATVLDYYRGDKTFQNFSTAAQAAVSATAPIVDTAGVFSIPAATNAVNGYLTAADHTSFAAKQNALGFTPEDVANKDIDGSLTANSDVKYPSQKAIKTYVDVGLSGKQNTLTPGAVSTTTTGVTVGSGANSTVGPNVTVDIQNATNAQPGLLTAADHTSFAAKEPAVTATTAADYYRGDKTFQNFNTAAQAAVSATAPIVDTAGVFSMPVSTNAVDGYLSAADHTSFAAKLGSGLTTNHVFVGVAGVATDVAMSGDATIASSGALTLAANAVTNAKAAQMAAHTFKGNNTGATANAIDLTATQATAELNVMVGDSGAGGTKGLVPAAGAGDAAAGKFLKADGTFAVPAAGSVTASTGYEPELWVINGGLSLFDDFDGVRRAENAKTIQKIVVCDYNNTAADSVTVTLKYGAALASSTTVTLAPGATGFQCASATPAISLSTNDLQNVSLTALSGSPEDLTVKTIY